MAQTFSLKQFSVSNRWWADWAGGGHTVQTDPSNRGWRAAKLSKDGDLVVVGRPGVFGCFSVRQMKDGRLDVAVYDVRTPESLKDSIPPADAYKVVDCIPGWALEFIQEQESLES